MMQKTYNKNENVIFRAESKDVAISDVLTSESEIT